MSNTVYKIIFPSWFQWRSYILICCVSFSILFTTSDGFGLLYLVFLLLLTDTCTSGWQTSDAVKMFFVTGFFLTDPKFSNINNRSNINLFSLNESIENTHLLAVSTNIINSCCIYLYNQYWYRIWTHFTN